MLCAGNPMGPGIAWVKRRWIDRVLDEYDDPNDYAFVQSLATDNPYIDQEYIRSLETQPEDRRNAMLFGSWTSFMGQYFTEFSKKTHVVEPFDIPRGHGTWYGGLDWGFSPDPAYFGLFWLSPEKVLYLVRELCVNRHTPSQLALAIKALCGENKPVVTIAGKDIWAEGSASKETGASIAAVLANNGVPCFPANTDRLNGWARVHEWLRPYDVPVVDETMGTTTYVPTAQFKIFSSCPEMIRSIENAVHDKVRAQDINTHGFDHPIDQLRYVCQHLPAPQVLTISTARITLDSEDFWRQLKEQAGCIVTHSHDPKKEGKHAGW